jgi:hypothetical protein
LARRKAEFDLDIQVLLRMYFNFLFFEYSLLHITHLHFLDRYA